MNRKTSLIAKGAALLAGCAFVPDTVHPVYEPKPNLTKINDAQEIAVDVSVYNEKNIRMR